MPRVGGGLAAIQQELYAFQLLACWFFGELGETPIDGIVPV